MLSYYRNYREYTISVPQKLVLQLLRTITAVDPRMPFRNEKMSGPRSAPFDAWAARRPPHILLLTIAKLRGTLPLPFSSGGHSGYIKSRGRRRTGLAGSPITIRLPSIRLLRCPTGQKSQDDRPTDPRPLSFFLPFAGHLRLRPGGRAGAKKRRRRRRQLKSGQQALVASVGSSVRSVRLWRASQPPKPSRVSAAQSPIQCVAWAQDLY